MSAFFIEESLTGMCGLIGLPAMDYQVMFGTPWGKCSIWRPPPYAFAMDGGSDRSKSCCSPCARSSLHLGILI